MTKLLPQAFEKASELPDGLPDQLATEVISGGEQGFCQRQGVGLAQRERRRCGAEENQGDDRAATDSPMSTKKDP